MRELLLLIPLSLLFIFGFFIMKNLDKYLEKNRQLLEKINSKKQQKML